MDINSLQSSFISNSTSSSFLAEKQKPVDIETVAQKTDSQNALERVKHALTESPVTQVQSKEDVDEVLSGLNGQLDSLQSFLKFEKDEDNQKMIFFIKNSETGEIIRQIPNKDLLDISKNISNYLEMAQQTEMNGKKPSAVGLITNQIA